jgi:hypothetical protein
MSKNNSNKSQVYNILKLHTSLSLSSFQEKREPRFRGAKHRSNEGTGGRFPHFLILSDHLSADLKSRKGCITPNEAGGTGIALLPRESREGVSPSLMQRLQSNRPFPIEPPLKHLELENDDLKVGSRTTRLVFWIVGLFYGSAFSSSSFFYVGFSSSFFDFYGYLISSSHYFSYFPNLNHSLEHSPLINWLPFGCPRYGCFALGLRNCSFQKKESTFCASQDIEGFSKGSPPMIGESRSLISGHIIYSGPFFIIPPPIILGLKTTPQSFISQGSPLISLWNTSNNIKRPLTLKPQFPRGAPHQRAARFVMDEPSLRDLRLQSIGGYIYTFPDLLWIGCGGPNSKKTINSSGSEFFISPSKFEEFAAELKREIAWVAFFAHGGLKALREPPFIYNPHIQISRHLFGTKGAPWLTGFLENQVTHHQEVFRDSRGFPPEPRVQRVRALGLLPWSSHFNPQFRTVISLPFPLSWFSFYFKSQSRVTGSHHSSFLEKGPFTIKLKEIEFLKAPLFGVPRSETNLEVRNRAPFPPISFLFLSSPVLPSLIFPPFGFSLLRFFMVVLPSLERGISPATSFFTTPSNESLSESGGIIPLGSVPQRVPYLCSTLDSPHSGITFPAEKKASGEQRTHGKLDYLMRPVIRRAKGGLINGGSPVIYSQFYFGFKQFKFFFYFFDLFPFLGYPNYVTFYKIRKFYRICQRKEKKSTGGFTPWPIFGPLTMRV